MSDKDNKFTDEQVQQISEIVRGALDEQQKETDNQRRERIREIKDPIERQREIAKNWDLFRGGVF